MRLASAARDGNALVRNDVSVVPWSYGLNVATVFGALNVAPKSVDEANWIASGRFPALNSRHAT